MNINMNARLAPYTHSVSLRHNDDASDRDQSESASVLSDDEEEDDDEEEGLDGNAEDKDTQVTNEWTIEYIVWIGTK